MMPRSISPEILLRRAARQARRDRQRIANVGRAQKMHLERIATKPATNSAAIKINFKKRPLLVGCSGWFYWHWKDKFYRKNLPTNKWFHHYAGQFKTVELNAPFYSWPTTATVNTWNRQAARRRFVYTVKVCELITHIKRFSRTKELVRDFYFIADILGPRMGCFLFQLPPSFRYTPARLKTILGQLDSQYRNVVEFRHKSWWNQTVFTAFEEAGIIFCSCSGPRLPDELVKTADDIYIRFHGITKWYRHDYTKDELAIWANRIRESGAKRVWAYFNNDRDGYAIKNAKELIRNLTRKPRIQG